jgi:hypothetical protein
MYVTRRKLGSILTSNKYKHGKAILNNLQSHQPYLAYCIKLSCISSFFAKLQLAESETFQNRRAAFNLSKSNPLHYQDRVRLN